MELPAFSGLNGSRVLEELKRVESEQYEQLAKKGVTNLMLEKDLKITASQLPQFVFLSCAWKNLVYICQKFVGNILYE